MKTFFEKSSIFIEFFYVFKKNFLPISKTEQKGVKQT